MHILTAFVGYMVAGSEAIEQGRLGRNLGNRPDVSVDNSHCTDAAESLAGSEEMAFADWLCTTAYV
jgi:hypothetical protein